jgi:hypothetical protein
MTLNLEGIAQLKADLRANAEHYNQNRFGKLTKHCGTECCMAGFCFMRKVGAAAFNALVKELSVDNRDGALYDRFTEDCVRAGCVQLGIVMDSTLERWKHPGHLPPIFDYWTEWPADLSAAYDAAEYDHDHAAMAEVACAALDRIDEYGCFNKEAV